jgi:drug/metabolite transporter (DMT)-like permease
MQAWMMLIGAPLLHVAALVLPGEELAAVTWSWSALAGLAYLAIVAAGVGYFLYFGLLDRVGAIEINLVAYATPIFAAVGGWFVLGDQIHSHTVVGFSVIVIGFTIIKRRALRAVAQ